MRSAPAGNGACRDSRPALVRAMLPRPGLARLLESQALEEVIGASVFGGDEPLIEERTRQMVIGGGENSARGVAR